MYTGNNRKTHIKDGFFSKCIINTYDNHRYKDGEVIMISYLHYVNLESKQRCELNLIIVIRDLLCRLESCSKFVITRSEDSRRQVR